jgi:hypothetical protein
MMPLKAQKQKWKAITMKQISRVLDSIKYKDWNPKLADMSSWRFERVPKQISSPTCLYTIRAQCILDGYDQIFAEWNVDEVDLRRREIAHLADPDEAYMNFIKAHFNDFMADVRTKFARHAARQAGLILPNHAKTPQIMDSKHQSQMNQFKNLMHNYRQKKARGRV